MIDDSAQPDPDNPVEPTLKRELNVGELSDVVYNGQAQEQVPVVTDKYGNVLVYGRDFTVSYAGDTTNVTDGGVTATVTGIGNYAGTAVRGYKVTPATLTVSTPSATKVYDGAALTAEGSYEGLVNGETIGFATTGSQTAAGSSANAYEIEWADAGFLGLIGGSGYTAKRSNYTVAETVGTLTVTAQAIDPGLDPENPDPAYKGVQINSPVDVVYDANEHKWVPTVTDAEGNLLTEDVDYTVSYGTEDFTNAGGAITVTITGIGSYTGTVAHEYKITPAQLVVTTGSATRAYNGQALTSAVLTVEGLKGKDFVTARATGSQTEVGSSTNTYSMSWTGALASNYVIARETLGTLTVTAAPVTPTPNNNGGTTPTTPADNGGTTPATPADTTGTTPAAVTPIDAVANALEDAYEAITGDEISDEAPAERIYDEENPLGAAEKHTCWVHFWMLLGIVATAIYGAFVWFRRTNHTRKLRKNMNDILGGGDEPDEDRSAAGSATPAGMEA